MTNGRYMIYKEDIHFGLTVQVEGDKVTYIDGSVGKLSDVENWTFVDIGKATTCFTCNQQNHCQFVDDLYNTNGECLAMK